MEMVKHDLQEESDETSEEDVPDSTIEIMAQTIGDPIKRPPPPPKKKKHKSEKKPTPVPEEKKKRSKSIIQKNFGKMQEKFSNIFASKNEKERRKFLKPKK